MLTEKQAELLSYLDSYIDKTNTSPSYDQMAKAIGLKSKSGVHRMILALEERGFVRRAPYRARAIEILRTQAGQIRIDADLWSSISAALADGEGWGSDLCRQVNDRLDDEGPSHAPNLAAGRVRVHSNGFGRFE